MPLRHRVTQLVCAGAFVFLFAATSAVAIPPPGVLYVAPGGVDAGSCLPESPCATIGYALSVAGPYDTIRLAAGTYAEQVRVPDDHTIVGAGVGQSIIVPPADLASMATVASPDGGRTAPIVEVAREEGDAGSTLQDLTVDGQDRTPCTSGEQGAIALSGIVALNTELTVNRVHVTGLQYAAPASGCADDAAMDGIVVANTGGDDHTTTIENTTVDRYWRDGIVVSSAPPESESEPAPDGPLATIDSVTVTGAAGLGSSGQTGILTDGTRTGVTSSTITSNVVNLEADGGPGAYVNTFGNTILGARGPLGQPGTGIRVTDGPFTSVSSRIVDNGVGLANTSGGTVDVRSNWWGCNGGPGAAGCDTISDGVGSVSRFAPWIILTIAPSGTQLYTGGATQDLIAGTGLSSGGGPAGSMPPGTPVHFTTTLGSVVGSTSFDGITDPHATLTSGSVAGPGTVGFAVDNGVASAAFEIVKRDPHPPPSPPINTAPPFIDGTVQVSQQVDCKPGTWVLMAPSVYRTVWLRDGKVIPGQISHLYTVRRADARHRLACRVTATGTDAYGSSSASATSAAVKVPVPEHAVLAPGVVGSGFHVNAAGVGMLPLQCVGTVGACTVTGTITTGGSSSGRATAGRVVVLAHIPTAVITVGKRKKVRIRLPRSLMTSVSKHATRQLRVAVTMATTAKAGAKTTVTQPTTIHFSRGAQRPAFTG